MNAKQNQIICFDVETGGLDKKGNKHALLVPITQIAVHSLYTDDFKCISEYESFVQPYAGLEYQPQALQFTGITMGDINGGQSIQKVVQDLKVEFTKALTGHKRYHKPTLLGHNVGYDIQFLQYAFAYCKEDLSLYVDGAYDGLGNFQPYYYDTLRMARAAWCADEDKQKFTLSDCCRYAGVELIEAHSALPDVRATVGLFQHLTTKSRGRGTAAGPAVSSERSRTSFKF